MEQELISGTIAAVVFQNHENGYAVIKFDSQEAGMITVVGTIPLPTAGERLIVTGKWTSHSVYGKQFEAEFLERLMPDSVEEIRAYLSSRAVKGIGPRTAEKIIAVFGADSLKILDTAPERLSEVPGISMKKAQEIGHAYRKQVGIRRLIEFTASYHIPAEIAVRVYRVYGEDAMEVIHDNPYILTQPQFGAGFAATDLLALESGVATDDTRRVEAAVIFVMRHNLNNGHTFLPMDKLVATTSGILELDEMAVHEAMERLCELGRVELDKIRNVQAVYLPEYYEAEVEISQRLLTMSETETVPLEGKEKLLSRIEHQNEIEYAMLQREAICAAAERKLLILTGGPGTGKTTTLAGILSMFDALHKKTLLAAPTGRAAKRLSELTGCEAATIHRLLEAQISPETGEMFFYRDEDQPLKCDALIIDEMSMVDVLLMHSVLKALPPKASLILVGDPDQLPSVGAGNVFGDLIRCGRIHTVALTEIFRQAQESLIVMNAHAVNQGQLPRIDVTDRDFFFMKRRNPEKVLQTIGELCVTRLPQRMGIPTSDIQVICPSRKGDTGTVNLNRVLQNAINPAHPSKKEKYSGERCFREGDRVMQIRNNYDMIWKRADGSAGTGIFNGDIGIITEVDLQADQLRISFDDREVLYDAELLSELELAYAITAHKSQGSEYRAVIFVSFSAASMLLTRGVLYTAMTRAKELMIMVGNEEIIAQMTANNHRNKRYSGLRFRLMQGE